MAWRRGGHRNNNVNSRNAQHQSNDSKESGQNARTSEHITNETLLVKWTKAVAFLTGGLVFVGIVTAVIFGWQLHVMQGQLDEMRFPNSDRPYLFVSHDDSQAPDPDQGVLQPGKELFLTFKNYGKGPAVYRGFQPRCGYFETNPPKLKFTEDLWAASVVLGSGDTIGPIDCPLAATVEQINLAQSGNGFIFLAGRLIYDDLASHPHETVVCLIYKPALKRFGLIPNAQGCNRYN